MSYIVENRNLDIKNIKSQCFIMALFIRGDGKRFLLGDGAFEFNDGQLHFTADDLENTIVEVQGGDGALLAGQVARSSAQEFDGYIADGGVNKKNTEYYRDEFISFFRKNYYYKVIYIYPDGSAKMRQRGYLVDAPEVKEIWQVHPEYHVAVNFEDVNYYNYYENDSGDEIFAKSAILTPDGGASVGGGLVWGESVYADTGDDITGVGVYWDDLGAVWESGDAGSDNIISVDTITPVLPRITIKGETRNPVISNITTGQTLTYNGTITSTQTLVIDLNNKTARLNGTNVLGNVSGDWIELVDGNNVMSYVVNGAGQSALIEWREIVG